MKLRRNTESSEKPPDEDGKHQGVHPQNPFREPISLLVLFLASLCAVTVLKPDGDPDIWARLAVGKLVMETGEVTVHDPFSYMPKKAEWIDHEWGAGVVFYLVAAAGGQVGLLLLKGLLIFGTILFMYLRVRRAVGRPPSLLFHLLLIGALYFGFLASIRAQAFTFFLFSAWFYLLERARDGDWRFAWLIPASGMAWANLHGGFLAGIGLIALFGLGEFLQRRPMGRFAALGAASAAVSLINPYGPTYWSYLFEATTMDRSTIPEWRPFDLLGPGALFLGFKVLLALAVVALVTKALRKEAVNPGTFVVLLVTAILGLRVVRHLTFFVIASAPFVWEWMASSWKFMGSRPGLPRTIWSLVTPPLEAAYYGTSRGLLLLGAVLILTTTPMRIVLFDAFPVRAVDFIAENGLKGNLLVPFNFGSYAIWRLYPDCRVAMDGRFETVYLNSTYDAVRGFFHGAPGWDGFLDQFRHDLILAPRNERLEASMASRKDWAVAYEDKGHRVYVRAERQRGWPPLGAPGRSDPFRTAGKPRYAS